MKKLFEQYLQAEFMKDFHGHKDQCEDAFDAWLSRLDNNELIEFGEEAIALTVKAVTGAIDEATKKLFN